MGFFGIIDAVVVVLGLLVMFLGYRRGFMNKMITILGVLVLLGLSIVLCGHLAEMMKDYNFIYGDIYRGIYDGIGNAIKDAGTNATVGQAAASALHLPEWIASLFVMGIKDELAATYQAIMADKITMFFMRLIAFGILFVGMIIIMIILKIIAHALRENKFIRVVDGIFGIALYLFLYILFISIVFFVLDILIDNRVISSTEGFIAQDFQLMDTTKYSLSRWLLKGNLISTIKNIFTK